MAGYDWKNYDRELEEELLKSRYGLLMQWRDEAIAENNATGKYADWNGGSVSGQQFWDMTQDALKYGYDVTLDPRNNAGARDAISDVLNKASLQANADAAAGKGDYDTNRQNYLNQIGWTDYQNVFKSLQETGTLGLKDLEGKSLEDAYGLGATQLNGNPMTGFSLEERLAAALAALPTQEELYQQAMAQQQADYVNQHLSPLMNGNNSGQGGSQGGAWGYDQNTDPVWAAILKQNTRAGEKAMNDALAQLSARTGGLASTYAGQVAQQTMGDYLQNATDYIPQLYDAAYGRWQDEQEMARAAEETAYRRQQDALDRQLAADQTAWERQAYADELAYNREQDALDRAFAQDQFNWEQTKYWNNLNKSSGSGGGMTFAQARDLLESGVDSPIARQIYESYTGIPWDPSLVKVDETTDKPNLSYDNIVELLESGTVNDQLLSGYKYYTGQDHRLASLSDPSVASIGDYESAISKLKEIGASKKDQMALATENEWRRKRESGSNSPEAAYDSYEEYLWAYIEFILNG